MEAGWVLGSVTGHVMVQCHHDVNVSLPGDDTWVPSSRQSHWLTWSWGGLSSLSPAICPGSREGRGGSECELGCLAGVLALCGW